jgi:VanZ family protein
MGRGRPSTGHGPGSAGRLDSQPMTPRQNLLAGRLAYVAVIVLATLTHLDVSWSVGAALHRLGRAFEPSMGWRDAVDGLRNLALFAGLGAVWIITSLEGTLTRETLRATVAGFVLSATVEGLQLFSSTRIASVLDIFTNTLGALGGALVVTLLIADVRRRREARSYFGLPASLLAGSYACALACEALVPLFRSNPLSGLTGGPLSSLGIVLQLARPLSFDEVPLLDIFLYAPAAFFIVILLAERGRPAARSWVWVAIAGALFSFGAELAHGLIRLSIRWEAAATHALALGFGAWAAHRWLAPLTRALRGPARARSIILTYMALLGLWGWRPLEPVESLHDVTAQLTLAHIEPLRSLAARVDVFSALHVAQQFLLYFPLGCLLAVWPLRLSGRWSHLTPALWLAAVIEAGHIFLAGRDFDVTNALLAGAGLGTGWIIVRRSGYRPYGDALPASIRPSRDSNQAPPKGGARGRA